jgi:predicted anti-sigma-YlaC factor YlaD
VTRVYHSRTCERSREWATLAVDGELSHLEQRLLDAHLARCASCATFATDVAAATEALRAEPLEFPPAAVALPTGFQRRRPSRLPMVAGRAAAVAAVAVGAFSVGTLSSSDPRDPEPLRPLIVDGATAESAQAEPEQLRAYRHTVLLEESSSVPPPNEHTGPQAL